jgi:hypothetical protein
MKNINNFPTKATGGIRVAYPSGCRVELVSTDDPFTNLKPGERGTVRCVDSIGTVFVDWTAVLVLASPTASTISRNCRPLKKGDSEPESPCFIQSKE